MGQLKTITIFQTKEIKSYIVENNVADKLSHILSLRDDIEDVIVSDAKDNEFRYNHYYPSTGKEDWLRIIGCNLNIKLVPLTEKDVSQPQGTALIMALYSTSNQL